MRRAYCDYADSGVTWLGKMPRHWEMTATKRRYHIQLGKMLQPQPHSEGDRETPYLKAQHVRWGQIVSDDLPIMWADALDRRVYGVELGDLLVCEGGEGGRSAIVKHPIGDCIIQNALHRVRPTSDATIEFLNYWLIAFSDSGWFDATNNKATISHFTREKFASLPLSLPPRAEQDAIVAFLDRETTRINELIAKQELLIERLDEYRTALITRAVTKGLRRKAAESAGLDPKPNLKDSGVEWLGTVPEHWTIAENRRFFSERDDRSKDGEGELLTVSHITGVSRRSDKPKVGMFMAETLAGYKRCNPGDLVVNTMWAWMGAAGTAAEAGLVSPSYNVYSPDRTRLIPRFVDMAYRSRRYVVGMTSESRGIWTSRLRLYPQQFLSLVTAVPPMAEQEAIVAHIDAAEDRAKRMERTISQAIERLQEYRSALISAAVTGKIDVRETALAGSGGGA